jgi:hypothetical protein
LKKNAYTFNIVSCLILFFFKLFPTNQPANQSASQPTNQTTNQTASQPINQPTKQTNHNLSTISIVIHRKDSRGEPPKA